jgi:predicted nucleotidyltransferase
MNRNGSRFKATPAKIARMVRRIVTRFDPERIILFGSRARGGASPDSDVDLLVVMPVQGSKRRKGLDIDLAVYDLNCPVDVVVVTPEEYSRHADIVGTVVYPAVREGKVLYARH